MFATAKMNITKQGQCVLNRLGLALKQGVAGKTVSMGTPWQGWESYRGAMKSTEDDHQEAMGAFC